MHALPSRLVALSLLLSLAGCYGSSTTPPPGEDAGGPDIDAGPGTPPPPPPPPPPPTGSLERAPVFGGTLLALPGGALLAGHPDMGQLVLLSSGADREVSARVVLEDGDVPGRAALSPDGLAHVVLRNGWLLTLDPVAGAVTRRVAVCAHPRGVTHQASTDAMVVTCAAGDVLRVGAGGEVVTLANHGPDLRDVVELNGLLYVSRFRSAELLELDADGALRNAMRPAQVTIEDPRLGTFVREPNVAYRIRVVGDDVMMLHQISTTSEIDVERTGYAGGGRCQTGVVSPVVTQFSLPSGGLPQTSGPLTGMALVVDFAVEGTAVFLASASVGAELLMGSATLARTTRTELAINTDCIFPDPFSIDERDFGSANLAVEAVTGGGIASLRSGQHALAVRGGSGDQIVSLGERVADPRGHGLFHTLTPSMVTCASCHPEGGDDGITWTFARVGPRRTQSLLGGLLGTEPFHRSGDVVDMEAIMRNTFAERMGQTLGPDDAVAVGAWLDAQPELSGVLSVPSAAAEGQAVFEARCASCHTGERLTDNRNHDVGTGESFQTPTLSGVMYRGPWLHGGCASTLEATLTTPCTAGPTHQVDDPDQRAAVVEYLRSL